MEQLRQSLEAKGYIQLAEVSFRGLFPFLRDALRSKNPFSTARQCASMVAAAATGVFGVLALQMDLLTVGQLTGWFLAGVLAVILLIPLHEAIHGLMLRRDGARDVRYGAVWRYLMFYAVAHGHVVRAPAFYGIALAPFAVISLACLAVFPFVPAVWQAFVLGTFFFHTLCCAGDFALCGYFYDYRHRQPLSFDDADAGISYFYALPEPHDAEKA
ncbi:DUF3267 domain-containing protein [Chitinophaga lutea]